MTAATAPSGHLNQFQFRNEAVFADELRIQAES